MNFPNENDLVISEFEPSSSALSDVGQKLGDTASDIGSGKISLRIGRKPTALPLIPFAKANGKPISSSFQALLTSYEPWVIFYSIGIQDTGDLRSVVRFGLTTRLLNQPTAGVVSVFPETQYLSVGGGAATWSAALGVSGELASPTDNDPGDDKTKSLLSGLATGSLGISGSAKADMGMNVSLSVITPLIITTGANDDQSQWTFTRGPQNLLVGDQIVGHVVLLKKPVSEVLKVETTLFVDIGLLWIFARRYKCKKPVTVEVRLAT